MIRPHALYRVYSEPKLKPTQKSGRTTMGLRGYRKICVQTITRPRFTHFVYAPADAKEATLVQRFDLRGYSEDVLVILSPTRAYLIGFMKTGFSYTSHSPMDPKNEFTAMHVTDRGVVLGTRDGSISTVGFKDNTQRAHSHEKKLPVLAIRCNDAGDVQVMYRREFDLSEPDGKGVKRARNE